MNNDDNNFPPLLPMTIGGERIQTVNARDLHAFMDVGRQFAAWLPDRIDQYGFVDGVDYVVFSETGKNPSDALPNFGETSRTDRFPGSESKGRGGRPTKEYAISLDMAKELAMVERNEKGRAVRRYFIQCEKRAKESRATLMRIPAPNTAAVRECRLTQAMNMKLLGMLGIRGNQAVLAASRGTKALTGIDPLAMMGVTHVDAPKSEALLSPTDIGRRVGLSAREVNSILCELGLQQPFRDGKNHLYYEPTEAGRDAGAVMQDTGKKHGNGVPVRQLRWSSSICDAVRAEGRSH